MDGPLALPAVPAFLFRYPQLYTYSPLSGKKESEKKKEKRESTTWKKDSYDLRLSSILSLFACLLKGKKLKQERGGKERNRALPASLLLRFARRHGRREKGKKKIGGKSQSKAKKLDAAVPDFAMALCSAAQKRRERKNERG